MRRADGIDRGQRGEANRDHGQREPFRKCIDAFDELAQLEFSPRLERLGLGVDIERGLLALLRSAFMAGAVAAIAAYNSNLELMRLQNSR